MIRSPLSAVVAVAVLAACSPTPPAEAGTRVVRIPVSIATESGDITFQAEVADSEEERRIGLMHRHTMGERESMLFLFPREEQLSFWMRNTLIPLDMIFIKTDRTILGVVENAEPRTDSSRRVPGASQFVLEINGGLAAKLEIKAGQKVTFYAPIPAQ